MRDYILPIPELKRIEPILTEYFGYKRAMFENELLATYYHEYPSGISEDICKNYMTDHSFLNTIAVDNGVFDYKRYTSKSISTNKAFNPSSFIMDSEHNILVTLPSNNMLERLIDLLQKYGETDNDGVIGISLLVVATIYEKYKNGELYTEVTISGYMELLFEADSFNNDENYTNAAIAYLVKQGYKPQWKPKQTEDYNFSPNNQSTEHLW